MANVTGWTGPIARASATVGGATALAAAVWGTCYAGLILTDLSRRARCVAGSSATVGNATALATAVAHTGRRNRENVAAIIRSPEAIHDDVIGRSSNHIDGDLRLAAAGGKVVVTGNRWAIAGT